MKSLRSFKTALGFLGLLCAFAGAPFARAASYSVTLNTAPLVGNAAGPFALDFQSIWGGTGSGQTITLSNFALTGGSFLAGTDWSAGAVSGSLLSTLVLQPGVGNFYNEFYQQFAATVTSISFNVDLTTNAAGSTPTSFAVSLLDGANFYNIPTTGFADTLVLFSIDGRNTGFQTATSTGATGGVTAAVPDTGGTVALVAGALVIVVFGSRRRRLVFN